MDRRERTQSAIANHRQLLEDLEQQVLDVRKSPQWTRLLEWQARFPQRSPNNNMLIQLQRPGATICRGYRQWQQHGRQVQKGEPGIAIWAPMTIRVSDEDDSDTRWVTRFKITYVFDIEQTEIFDEELAAADESPQPIIDGESHLYETLLTLCDDQGIEVTERPQLAEGAAQWNTSTGQRTIILRPDRPDAHKAIVMLHELAHIALHQQRSEDREIPIEQKEWEAESVAYVVASHYELPTFSDLYLATWKVEEGDLSKLLARISSCASGLIEQIDAVGSKTIIALAA